MLRANHHHPPSMISWVALVIASIALALVWNMMARTNPGMGLGEALRLQLPSITNEEAIIRDEMAEIQLSLDNSMSFDALATGVAKLRESLRQRRALFAEEDVTEWEEELQRIGERLETGGEEVREDLRTLLRQIEERLAL